MQQSGMCLNQSIHLLLGHICEPPNNPTMLQQERWKPIELPPTAAIDYQISIFLRIISHFLSNLSRNTKWSIIFPKELL